jgi:cytochrome P450
MATPILDTGSPDPHVDITSHDTYLADFPHAAFRHLRRESPAVWTEEADGSGFWSVTRHADVVEVSRDYGRFTAARGIRIEEMDPEELEARRSMMELDPPDHTRLRRLVQPGFTPKVTATYEEAFRKLVDVVLDRVLPMGEFDFVTEIARELPIRMLCRLLGIPESDASRMVTWGDQMISNADPEYTPVIVDKMDTEEYRLLPFRSPAALEVYKYAEEIALQRRADPRDDIITKLLTTEPDGEPLTDLEFKNFFTLLMVAGNETTRHTISHGLRYLSQAPEQLAWWREDVTGRSMVATDEILRASAVTMHFRRTVVEDTRIGEVDVGAGDRVVIWYTSANYDDSVFSDPFVFDLSRRPNAHVTFGTGRHKCLGASLAELEVRVFFEEFLARVDDFEVGEPDRLRSNFIRGIKHLPVRVE